MNSPTSITLGSIALGLVLVVMTLATASYGQQEVDPMWYDPWPAAKKEVKPAPRPRKEAGKANGKIAAVSPQKTARKRPVKRLAKQSEAGPTRLPSR